MIYTGISEFIGYIGPGTGLSLGGALIGVVVALGMSIGLTLLWPLRVMSRKLLGKKSIDSDNSVAESSENVLLEPIESDES